MNIRQMIDVSEAKLKGFWTMEAHAPVLIADPDKFRALAGLPARQTLRKKSDGLAPLSLVRSMLAKMNRFDRRELEKLLSGGNLLWREAWQNIVVNEGLNYVLDASLSGGTPDTSWFVGLILTNPPVVAAGD